MLFRPADLALWAGPHMRTDHLAGGDATHRAGGPHYATLFRSGNLTTWAGPHRRNGHLAGGSITVASFRSETIAARARNREMLTLATEPDHVRDPGIGRQRDREL